MWSKKKDFKNVIDYLENALVGQRKIHILQREILVIQLPNISSKSVFMSILSKIFLN